MRGAGSGFVPWSGPLTPRIFVMAGFWRPDRTRARSGPISQAATDDATDEAPCPSAGQTSAASSDQSAKGAASAQARSRAAAAVGRGLGAWGSGMVALTQKKPTIGLMQA